MSFGPQKEFSRCFAAYRCLLIDNGHVSADDRDVFYQSWEDDDPRPKIERRKWQSRTRQDFKILVFRPKLLKIFEKVNFKRNLHFDFKTQPVYWQFTVNRGCCSTNELTNRSRPTKRNQGLTSQISSDTTQLTHQLLP
ncbi:hypothetical protein O181_029866 [Austropuccinia psidii MF-1]|uniref:Uncharacterized protein n=1 Tax=Austropuccinia psidii MF-1 TaxID=1389203 RepID=A0A9Q3H3P9_9BASI|nr:hypothetical protein [Austropuccinia psidii MF-1]